MCKIMVMPGITPETNENAWKFVKAMAKEMSTFNDRDGLGYAAIGSDGRLFGERWWHNNEAFNTREPLTELERMILEAHGGMLGKTMTYNSFGEVQENDLRSIILHTRLATSGKVFSNTHPFVHENTALIHNGIIHNADKIGTLKSTCDSEAILKRYIDEDVANNPEKIQDVADSLDGYYACGIITTTRDGQSIVDVFKDTRADLTAFFIKELDTMVYCTKDLIVESVCKDLKFEILSKFLVRSGSLIRYDAMSGDVLFTTKFDPTGPDRLKKASSSSGSSSSSYAGWSGSSAASCATATDCKPSSSTPEADVDDETWNQIMQERVGEALGTNVIEYEEFVIDKDSGKWRKPGKGGKNGKHSRR